MPNTKNAIGFPTSNGEFEEMATTAPKVNENASNIPYDNSQSGLTATDVQDAIDEINSDLSELRGKLLWENSNPTSSFATQDITFSANDYSILKIVCALSTSTTAVKTFEAHKGNNLRMDFVDGTYDGKPAPFVRTAHYVNDSKYNISDCIVYSASGSSTNNNECIPIAVYGVK